MGSYNKFNLFVDWLSKGSLNLATGADAIKVMLTNTVPVATNSVYGDISGTELANGNGYTTGGVATTQTTTNASGTEKLVATNAVWTAATGTMGPFRYAVFYDSGAANKALIGWWDYGSSLNMNPGDTFTVSFDAVNGVLTLA